MKLLTLLTVLISQVALAKVNVANTRPVQLPIAAASNAWTYSDVQQIIPTGMSGSNDAGYVASQIGDHAFQSFWNSPRMKNSSVGRTANKVQESMKTEMVVKSDDKNSVDHKITFQVLALQAISKLQYTGWINAEVNFDARAQQTNVELTEKVFKDKDFVISHSATTTQDLSSVGLRWNW